MNKHYSQYLHHILAKWKYDVKFIGFLTHGNYILAKKIDRDMLEGSKRIRHEFFFPLEKAYDRMLREVLWTVLEK
jgi:hypothetical protein